MTEEEEEVADICKEDTADDEDMAGDVPEASAAEDEEACLIIGETVFRLAYSVVGSGVRTVTPNRKTRVRQTETSRTQTKERNLVAQQ